MNMKLLARLGRESAKADFNKRALDLASVGGQLSDFWGGLTPENRSSIIGGVGGLGLGAIGGGLLGGGEGALMGALAGGGFGAFGGRNHSPLLNYFKKQDTNNTLRSPENKRYFNGEVSRNYPATPAEEGDSDAKKQHDNWYKDFKTQQPHVEPLDYPYNPTPGFKMAAGPSPLTPTPSPIDFGSTAPDPATPPTPGPTTHRIGSRNARPVAPAAPLPGSPGGAQPGTLFRGATPQYKLSDMPQMPRGYEGGQDQYNWNTALTHGYQHMQGIGLDADGAVIKPYNMDNDQMRDLSHYVYPTYGEGYRMKGIRERGEPYPYANEQAYNAAKKQFTTQGEENRQRLVDYTRSMYPEFAQLNKHPEGYKTPAGEDPRPSTSDVAYSTIPPNTLRRLQAAAQRSLQTTQPSQRP